MMETQNRDLGRQGVPDLATQASYYSHRWRSFEYANRINMALIAKILEFVSSVELPPGFRICDLGCGSGWSTNLLHAFGESTGIDLSDTSPAQLRYSECHFKTANILGWQPTLEFDLVVSMEVLEHVEVSDRDRLVCVMRDALKPHGFLALTTPSARTMKAIPGGGRSYSNQPIENWLNSRELNSLLKRNGFRIRAMASVWLGVGYRGLYRFVNSPRVNCLVGKLRISKLFRAAVLKAGFGLHFVVFAEKL